MFSSHSTAHPSVRALLAAEGGEDPSAAIRRRARALVDQAMEIGWEGPPFDVTELASLRGLRVETSTGFASDQDACVTPGRILLNARKHRVRQRYSIAHEVGHTLFPDYEEELRREGVLWRREGNESEFERLCQEAGAELLFPLNPFRVAVGTRGASLSGVLALAEDFDASIEATARRLVETFDAPMAAVFLRPVDPSGTWLEIDSSADHDPRVPLAVSLVCTNDAAGAIAIPRGTRPPLRGAADRAWKRASLARGRVVIERVPAENWSPTGIPSLWESEAVTLPKARNTPHEVLCLLRPTGA